MKLLLSNAILCLVSLYFDAAERGLYNNGDSLPRPSEKGHFFLAPLIWHNLF